MIILGQFLASSLGTSLTSANAKNNNKSINLQNEILYFNNTDPIVDGDLESYEGEWENATTYTNEFGTNHVPVNLKVQANLTHIFIGITYTSSIYVPINTTIPVGDSYNNQSHTWYVITFDRNYDRRSGSELAPDDAIAINYRDEGAQDSFINGTDDINSFITDLNVSGDENAYAVLTEYEDDFHDHVVTIEIVKELKSGDTLGNDISLNPSDSMDFNLIVFQNYTASFNYSKLFDYIPTSWLSFTLETKHTYFSYIEDFSTMDVLLYVTNSYKTGWEEMSSFSNFLSSYGMNVTKITPDDDYVFTTFRLSELDSVILTGSLKDLSDEEIDALRLYVASGGRMLILGDAGRRNQRVNDLLAHFGMEIYNSTLFSKNTAVNSSISIDNSAFGDLPYLLNNSAFTDQTIDLLDYDGSAINFTKEIGENYTQFQEADMYPTIEVLGDYFIDLDKDGVFNSTSDLSINDSATLQATVELLRGGRLIVTASADFVNNSLLVSATNRYMVLRQLQWLLGFQNVLTYEDYVVSETEVFIEEAIGVEISITADNGTSLKNLKVWVAAQELKTDLNCSEDLTTVDNVFYNGSITPETTRNKAKFVDISIRMHLRGYGYNETYLYQVYVAPVISKPLDVDIVALLLFIVSIGLVGVGAFALKKYKFVEEES
jgi:hypothetical protein